MPGSKVIIGLVGEMAAGKTTVTDYLKEKYGAVSFRFSDMLRDMLARLHMENTRENLQQISTALRHTFGDDIMSKVIAEDVKAATAPFIITEGVRRPSDVAYLKTIPGYRIVAIAANERTRYERIIQRSENPDDQKKSWEEFQAEGKREAEQKIKEIAASADMVLDNNGSKETLYKQVDALMNKYANNPYIQHMPSGQLSIKIKRLHPDAKLPSYAHPGDVGLDLYSLEEYTLQPWERKIFPLGFALEFDTGYAAIVKDKSSLPKDGGLHTIGGVFDAGYRGEYNAYLVNLGLTPYAIQNGQKIAQLVIFPVAIATLVETSALSDSSRGNGQFGSTGKF